MAPADGGRRVEARAERVLAEYLRQWGLRDPFAIAAHCREWVRRVTERQAVDGTEEHLARAALGEAVGDLDRWLDHLALLVSPDPAEAAALRGLLAMAIPAVIDEYPQSFLQYESLPEPLLQHLRAAARPVVPLPAQPTRMDGPPLGELHPLLQPQQWRRLVARLATATLDVVGYKRGGSS
jgi:hypothetical protein